MDFTISPPVDRLAATLPVGLLATKVCTYCKSERDVGEFWSSHTGRLTALCQGCRDRSLRSQSKSRVKRLLKKKRNAPVLYGESYVAEDRDRIRLAAQEARRIIREEEEEKNAPSPQQIRFMAKAMKLLGIRRLMESGREDEAEFQGSRGNQNEDWRDPFLGIKFVTRSQIQDQPQICDCPYWQHEIQHA